MTAMPEQALTITVLQGETVVCAVDAAGRVLVPSGAAERALIVAALGQALASVATLQPAEQQEQDAPCFHNTIDMLAERLGLIGTDQSTAVSMMLTERINAVAETMSLANTLIAETAVAEGERARGVAEH